MLWYNLEVNGWHIPTKMPNRRLLNSNNLTKLICLAWESQFPLILNNSINLNYLSSGRRDVKFSIVFQKLANYEVEDSQIKWIFYFLGIFHKIHKFQTDKSGLNLNEIDVNLDTSPKRVYCHVDCLHTAIVNDANNPFIYSAQRPAKSIFNWICPNENRKCMLKLIEIGCKWLLTNLTIKNNM